MACRQRATLAAGGAEHRHDSDLGQERSQTHYQIFLAIDDGAFAKDVFVPVHVGVDQPSAFLFVLGEAWPARDVFQMSEEPVGFVHADGQAQAMGSERRMCSPETPRRVALTNGSSELDGGPRSGCERIAVNRRAPAGIFW